MDDALTVGIWPVLAACPFCGAVEDDISMEWMRSRVMNDGVTRPAYFLISCGRCPAQMSGTTKDGAASAWNRRATHPSNPCTCMTSMEDDAYELGGPMSRQKRPPLCTVHPDQMGKM